MLDPSFLTNVKTSLVNKALEQHIMGHITGDHKDPRNLRFTIRYNKSDATFGWNGCRIF